MSYVLSPYDREGGFLETNLSLAVLFSVGLHIVLAWMFFVVFPTLMTNNRDRLEEVITVQILGSLAPPAPPAPAAPVNPDLKGPDVVEMPQSDPTPTPQPPLTPVQPETAPPADVIALGPKAPEKPPEIKKTQASRPKVTPPKVVKETKPNNDAAINNVMRNLERKVEAEKRDEAINSRMADLSKTVGQGSGEGSESGGATSGQRVHPEKMRYYAHIKDLVSENWRPPTGSLERNLVAQYQLTIQPNGQVNVSRFYQSSGDPAFDESVTRAINMSLPFPPLPPIFEGRPEGIRLGFDPKEQRRRQSQQ